MVTTQVTDLVNPAISNGSNVGATITVNNQPIAGQVLTATSSSAATWQSITSGSITLSGDVTGAANTNTVSAISGSSPIPITPASLQWLASTASPTLVQATATSDVATKNLTIQSQAPFASAATNQLAGNINLSIPSGVGGAVGGSVSVLYNGTNCVAFGPQPGNAAYRGIYGVTAPASANHLLLSNGTNTILNTEGSGPLTFSLGGSNQVNITSGSINMAPSVLSWINSVAPSILQNTQGSDTATHNLTITSQAPYSAAVTNILPGNLVLNVPAPISGTTTGYVQIQNGGSNALQVGLLSGTTPCVWGAATPSTTNYMIADDGTNTYVNGPTTGVVTQVASSTVLTTSATAMTFANGVSSPTLSQASPTTDVSPKGMTIQSQSAFSTATVNRIGGELLISSGSGAGGIANNAGKLVLTVGGTTGMLQMDGYGIELVSQSFSVTAGGTVTLAIASGYLVPSGGLINNTTLVLPAHDGASWLISTFSTTFNGHTLTLQANGVNWGTVISTQGVWRVYYLSGPGKLYGYSLSA